MGPNPQMSMALKQVTRLSTYLSTMPLRYRVRSRPLTRWLVASASSGTPAQISEMRKPLSESSRRKSRILERMASFSTCLAEGLRSAVDFLAKPSAIFSSFSRRAVSSAGTKVRAISIAVLLVSLVIVSLTFSVLTSSALNLLFSFTVLVLQHSLGSLSRGFENFFRIILHRPLTLKEWLSFARRPQPLLTFIIIADFSQIARWDFAQIRLTSFG